VEGSCKHGNEHSGSIKCCEILVQLSDWQLLKNDSSPWSFFTVSRKGDDRRPDGWIFFLRIPIPEGFIEI
jgi:hypothetical protein